MTSSLKVRSALQQKRIASWKPFSLAGDLDLLQLLFERARLDLGKTEGQAKTHTEGKLMLKMSRQGRPVETTAVAIAFLTSALLVFDSTQSSGDTNDDGVVAESLAAMLRAGRTVVSRHQTEINDPAVGDKNLTDAKILGEAVQVYSETTKTDPKSIDPS